MLAPEDFLELSEFHLELPATFSFQMLNQTGNGHVRWNGQHEVDVIGSNRTFQNIHFVSGANLADDISEAISYVIFEDLFPVFCTPDNMVLAVIDRMSGAIVACHTSIISLKVSA